MGESVVDVGGLAKPTGGKAKSGAEGATNDYTKTLAELAQGFAEETAGVRGGLNQMFESLVRTGNAQALNPIVSNAVDASRRATSGALKEAETSLASSGLAGTPFGEGILANIQSQGRQSTAAIPGQFAQQILQMIPNYILGQASTGLTGLSSASQQVTDLTREGFSRGVSALSGGK